MSEKFASSGIWTHDLLIARLPLYQLSYRRLIKVGQLSLLNTTFLR